MKLALSYFVLTALLYCVLLFTTADNISMISITLYLLGFVLSLPWSAIGLWFTYETRTSEINIHLYVGLMLFGTAVNAVLLYLAAVKMRRSIQ